MSTGFSSLTSTAQDAWIPSFLYRMSVEEFEAFIAANPSKESEKVQLVNGFLVTRMTHNPPHAIADELVGCELARVFPGWHVRAAKPIRFSTQATMNEPDRCVVRGAARQYLGRHPGPDDIVLLIEVADSSLAEDRKLGNLVYGPAGVTVYWIINLIDRQIEVYTGPGPAGYSGRRDYRAGELVPVSVDGQELGVIAVDVVMP